MGCISVSDKMTNVIKIRIKINLIHNHYNAKNKSKKKFWFVEQIRPL